MRASIHCIVWLWHTLYYFALNSVQFFFFLLFFFYSLFVFSRCFDSWRWFFRANHMGTQFSIVLQCSLFSIRSKMAFLITQETLMSCIWLFSHIHIHCYISLDGLPDLCCLLCILLLLLLLLSCVVWALEDFWFVIYIQLNLYNIDLHRFFKSTFWFKTSSFKTCRKNKLKRKKRRKKNG